MFQKRKHLLNTSQPAQVLIFFRQTNTLRMIRLCLFTIMLLLPAACGGGSPAVEEETIPAVTATPTAAVRVVVTPTADTRIPVITLEAAETYPAADAPMPADPSVAEGGSAVSALDAVKTTACEIESDLDLAGYPDLEEVMGCPTAPADFSPVAINEFGESAETDRFMLWFSSDDLIYVLLPDGVWTTYEDTWDESQPEYLCNPYGGEMTSPPLPRRGFGKLWCEDADLQAILGPVPREERLCQHTVVQPFHSGRMLACFEDATIRYFQLHDDRTWTLDVQR